MDPPIIGDSYDTEPGSTSWFGKLSPTLCFHPRMMWIIWRGSNQARRGLYGDEEWRRSSYGVLRALERAGVMVDVRNAGTVHSLGKPCVVAANHMSTLETFVLPFLLLPHVRVTFVVKQSLIDYPVFGHVMRSRNPIVVTRENPRRDLETILRDGTDRLNQGYTVVVFPQKTRSVAFDPSSFNTVGIKLARRAGVPVVPLALKTDAWPNGKWFKDYGRIDPGEPVHFRFGEPLPVSGNGKETHRQVIRFIETTYAEWEDGRR